MTGSALRTDDSRGSTTFWVAATILAFVAMLGVNALANLLPIAGRETGDVSANYPILVTPAPFTFSIWGVIYLALAVFVVYQALPAGRTANLNRVRQLFVLSCAFNIGWLLAWHNLLIPLSQLLMFGLLATLIGIYVHLRRNRELKEGTSRWLTRIPFSLYLGWISVATLANLGVLLYDWGLLVDATYDFSWALLALAILTLVNLWILGARGDVVFAAVAVWASVGILAADLGVSSALAVAAGVAAAVVALRAVFALLRSGKVELLA